MYISRRVARMMILLAGGMAAGSSMAVCNVGPVTNADVDADPVQFGVATFTFERSVISIPRDATVGSVLVRASFARFQGNGRRLICSTKGDRFSNRSRTPSGYDYSADNTLGKLIANGVDSGVGYQMFRSETWWGAKQLFGSVENLVASTDGSAFGYSQKRVWENWREIVLIKTGNAIRPGVLFPAGTKLELITDGNLGLTITTSNSVSVVPQTCLVTAPSSVSLGDRKTADFKGVNSTTTAVNFNVNVDCTGVTSAVHATVSDPRDSSNRSDRLPLTASSSARGVAVQILRNGIPINFGPDSVARGNANQFKLFDASASQPRFTAAFQARYLQTVATVTPGTANSVMTMTMSYQ